MRRRDLLGGACAALLPTEFAFAGARSGGRLKQGVTRLPFPPDASLDTCCAVAAHLGVEGFDFIGAPDDWPTLRRHGLTMSMYRLDYGGGASNLRSPPGPPGWNAIGLKAAGGEFLKAVHDGIELCARERMPNLFLQAGSRRDVGYEEGAQNAIAFCNEVKAHAEQKGVTLCMELINSKVSLLPLSLFDHAEWGFRVVKAVNSPRVKVLYDIFHAQLMDGDLARTIRDNIGWIGHFHAAGAPDRHELNEAQEINYRFLAGLIADLGYQGFISHEWSPSPGSSYKDALAQSVAALRVRTHPARSR